MAHLPGAQLPGFIAEEMRRSDSYFSLLADPHLADVIVGASKGVLNFTCDGCKRVCGVYCVSTSDMCPECDKLARFGAWNKVWRPDGYPEVAAKIIELFPGLEQRFEVKKELNIRIRWENRNRPKRLLRNSDVGIPAGWVPAKRATLPKWRKSERGVTPLIP